VRKINEKMKFFMVGFDFLNDKGFKDVLDHPESFKRQQRGF